jgi:hypothetical protein
VGTISKIKNKNKNFTHVLKFFLCGTVTWKSWGCALQNLVRVDNEKMMNFEYH